MEKHCPVCGNLLTSPVAPPPPLSSEALGRLAADIEQDMAMEEIIRDANEVCRSAYQIAVRRGAETGWDLWIARLEKTLKIQHRFMYPESQPPVAPGEPPPPVCTYGCVHGDSDPRCPVHGTPPAPQERASDGRASDTAFRAAEIIYDWAEEWKVTTLELAHEIEKALATAAKQAREEALEEANLLRRELWLSHGHQGIYGDDGEMQCGECDIDYKRDSVESIIARRTANGLRKLAAPQKEKRK